MTSPNAHYRLARITIYPIKSFDGYESSSFEVLRSGGLADDRRWALVTSDGAIFNAKRSALLQTLRVEWLDTPSRARFVTPHGVRIFELNSECRPCERFLSEVLQEPLRLVEDAERGFPDDTDSPGPTVVSTATLETVANWFPGLTVEEVRRRMRANLEVDGTEPFWEDGLYGEAGTNVRFWIGDVELEGTNPCQRCVVPTRDSRTGVAAPGFAVEFSRRRAAGLPFWVKRSRFDHFYRLAVNTRLASRPGRIAVGDVVRSSNPRSLWDSSTFAP